LNLRAGKLQREGLTESACAGKVLRSERGNDHGTYS
jgi:hypothetical protein